jgi:hypothetical protein
MIRHVELDSTSHKSRDSCLRRNDKSQETNLYLTTFLIRHCEEFTTWQSFYIKALFYFETPLMPNSQNLMPTLFIAALDRTSFNFDTQPSLRVILRHEKSYREVVDCNVTI